MKGYELTDRGKIALTVVLAVLFFFLSAAIIMFKVVANQPPDVPADDDLKASASPPASPFETPPPVIAESPPPNGGGFNPPDTSPPTDPGSGEHGAADGQSPSPPPGSGTSPSPPPGSGTSPSPPPGSEPSPSPPPGSGQGRVDSIEGTLSFLFSPNENGKLGAEASSMMDEFLSSPKNTLDNAIAVVTPKLTGEIREIFVPAIADALSSRGVDEGRIAYFTDQRVPMADAFEVNLYYFPRRGK